METKKPIASLSFEDLKNFTEINTEMISKIFEHNESFETFGEKIVQPILQEILEEMKLAIPSIAILRQNQPTRFMIQLTEEILRASEKIKLRNRYHDNIEFINRDIKRTREQIKNSLANTYRTETVLFSLLDSKQFIQALTMVEALEIERLNENIVMKVEVLNWKLELMSKLGDDNGFFETLNKLLAMVGGEEVKYEAKSFKLAIEHILMKKFIKGIPFSLNSYGIEQSKKDHSIPQKVGESFQELLVDKTLDAVMKTRIIESSVGLNMFLKNEWENIVWSFRLMNPYVGQIPKPNYF